MFKQLPFKKEYLLTAATLILLLVSYQLAFKKTIEAWHVNSDLKRQLNRSTDISYQPGYLERKNINLGKFISLYKADTVDFRSNIISIISSIAEKANVKLAEVPMKDPLYHNAQFIIQRLNFEGDYFSLIKTLDRLQSTSGIGVIRAVSYKTIPHSSENEKTKKLMMEVYLEIINN